MKRDRLAEQRVGADHDVDVARGEALADLGRLLGRHEARDLLDPERQPGEALAHHLEMLADQQRRRREDRDLPAGHRDDERGAQRDLGLAEADIAADQPVHRVARREIVEDRLDRAGLILGLVIGEARGELLVEPRRRGQLDALPQSPPGRELDQLAGDLADPLLDLGLPGLPAEPAQLVERDVAFGSAIAREHVEVLDRHEQLVAAVVDQAQAVVRRAAELERDEAVVAADAVVLVDHEVALAERCDLGDELVAAPGPAGRARESVADDVGLGQHAVRGRDEALRERQNRERRRRARRALVPMLDPVQALDPVVGEHHAQPLERAFARAGDHDAAAGGLLLAQMLRHGVEQVAVGALRARRRNRAPGGRRGRSLRGRPPRCRWRRTARSRCARARRAAQRARAR